MAVDPAAGSTAMLKWSENKTRQRVGRGETSKIKIGHSRPEAVPIRPCGARGRRWSEGKPVSAACAGKMSGTVCSRLSAGVVFQLYAFGASPAECGGRFGIPPSPRAGDGDRPYATHVPPLQRRRPLLPRSDITLNLVAGRVSRNPVGPRRRAAAVGTYAS